MDFAYEHRLGDGVDKLLPHVEHKFCAWHAHANFKTKGYKWKAFKDELWIIARATHARVFKHHMKVIQKMDVGACWYLSDVNPSSWSRHAFPTQSKSDMLLNKLAEIFNVWIKEARDKPLLTILEMIRRQLMTRFHQKRNRILAVTHIICPKIQKKLERSKDDAKNCM